MKRTLFTLFAAGLLAFGTLPMHAQNGQYILGNTTLNGAVNATQTTLTLAAVTKSGAMTEDMVVGHELFFGLEAATVTAINGLVVSVRRGVDGTVQQSHKTAEVVFWGDSDRFQQSDPPYGSCTTATMLARPWINVRNGNVWLCKSSIWTATNVNPITWNSVDPY